ncbi:central glycolytic genes regulator [Caldanaerobius fijiensis DSM 17918]|uniref:Central glycolytic genes regulator n=1 Tax=Caldanaerobius fijiensis DSM 17918 TaxID=1121256 RepID=A0A1M5CTH7_9THEO|nr:sugar-binding domain-containing protein [Caldanaerobius fijiensis]SHF58031.1 central glycolytic genes regulator [Caldanaerobius fijiensis DSM 17918]
MNDIITIQKKIVPELVELLGKRYSILKCIYYNQPVGRRMLSDLLKIGERTIRTEVYLLKEQGLIDVNPQGMSVTAEGESLLEGLKDFIHELKGLNEIENVLKRQLNLKDVVVTPGNIDEDYIFIKDLGKAAAEFLKKNLRDDLIIAITGGSTVAELANAIESTARYNNITVVPARGGFGRDVEKQANTIAANLAKKLHGNYKLLHIPDNIGKSALDSMLNEPDIKNVIDIIKKADILIYGIGRADEMVKRRNLSDEEISQILNKGAVAEAFGYYFDRNGDIVYVTTSVCLTIQDIEHIPCVMAMAGGSRKAEAILATCKAGHLDVLITDEGAANKMMELLEVKHLNGV